eukprot:GHVS01095171.1.p1 GENE.GHVS01095171.1~~GHVS01095171.1.p1  ORF type:complete len:1164 (-),score=117.09 GHVS01095171.1:496-3987(-)
MELLFGLSAAFVLFAFLSSQALCHLKEPINARVVWSTMRNVFLNKGGRLEDPQDDVYAIMSNTLNATPFPWDMNFFMRTGKAGTGEEVMWARHETLGHTQQTWMAYEGTKRDYVQTFDIRQAEGRAWYFSNKDLSVDGSTLRITAQCYKKGHVGVHCGEQRIMELTAVLPSHIKFWNASMKSKNLQRVATWGQRNFISVLGYMTKGVFTLVGVTTEERAVVEWLSKPIGHKGPEDPRKRLAAVNQVLVSLSGAMQSTYIGGKVLLTLSEHEAKEGAYLVVTEDENWNYMFRKVTGIWATKKAEEGWRVEMEEGKVTIAQAQNVYSKDSAGKPLVVLTRDDVKNGKYVKSTLEVGELGFSLAHEHHQGKLVLTQKALSAHSYVLGEMVNGKVTFRKMEVNKDSRGLLMGNAVGQEVVISEGLYLSCIIDDSGATFSVLSEEAKGEVKENMRVSIKDEKVSVEPFQNEAAGNHSENAAAVTLTLTEARDGSFLVFDAPPMFRKVTSDYSLTLSEDEVKDGWRVGCIRKEGYVEFTKSKEIKREEERPPVVESVTVTDYEWTDGWYLVCTKEEQNLKFSKIRNVGWHNEEKEKREGWRVTTENGTVSFKRVKDIYGAETLGTAEESVAKRDANKGREIEVGITEGKLWTKMVPSERRVYILTYLSGKDPAAINPRSRIRTWQMMRNIFLDKSYGKQRGTEAPQQDDVYAIMSNTLNPTYMPWALNLFTCQGGDERTCEEGRWVREEDPEEEQYFWTPVETDSTQEASHMVIGKLSDSLNSRVLAFGKDDVEVGKGTLTITCNCWHDRKMELPCGKQINIELTAVYPTNIQSVTDEELRPHEKLAGSLWRGDMKVQPVELHKSDEKSVNVFKLRNFEETVNSLTFTEEDTQNGKCLALVEEKAVSRFKKFKNRQDYSNWLKGECSATKGWDVAVTKDKVKIEPFQNEIEGTYSENEAVVTLTLAEAKAGSFLVFDAHRQFRKFTSESITLTEAEAKEGWRVRCIRKKGYVEFNKTKFINRNAEYPPEVRTMSIMVTDEQFTEGWYLVCTNEVDKLVFHRVKLKQEEKRAEPGWRVSMENGYMTVNKVHNIYVVSLKAMEGSPVTVTTDDAIKGWMVEFWIIDGTVKVERAHREMRVYLLTRRKYVIKRNATPIRSWFYRGGSLVRRP